MKSILMILEYATYMSLFAGGIIIYYEKAFKILIEGKGKQFDPVVVDAFLSIEKELIEEELKSLDLLRIYRSTTG